MGGARGETGGAPRRYSVRAVRVCRTQRRAAARLRGENLSETDNPRAGDARRFRPAGRRITRCRTAPDSGRNSIPTADILGIRLHAVTTADVLAQIERFIAAGTPHQICTVNPEFVVAAQRDLVFRQIINRAALAFADGTGLLKAARWLGETPLPERIAGVDTVESLAQLSAEKEYRLYFLGAQPGVAEKA
ncbi:MAG TPA: hypothetical protein ENJ48_00200, partial [Anaerolineae bacterium]|nr:hypothetical protein [Anaerolineae bacterium]